MQTNATDWNRPYYAPGGGDAYLFYVVYGEFNEELELDAGRYRSSGVPPNIEIEGYSKEDNPEEFGAFIGTGFSEVCGDLGEELASQARASCMCLSIRGPVSDPATLDYLRDVVGVLTALLESGGVVLLDVLALRWWQPDDWRNEVFNPAGPVPRQHVVVLVTAEADQEESVSTLWVHTRGMRKFGRPDLSIPHVEAGSLSAATELCNRFIDLQASGHIIPEGQEVRIAGLPAGLVCHHRGDLDDPLFNNVHVQIARPGLQ